uniref:Uncharacterized protein n=1 Tax=Tanacetum cinerariifolium TaxID=118510 RepID=A0A699GJF4_TANCI|nr:hypothetical protein [Tanacetum cinerariifolium]
MHQNIRPRKSCQTKIGARRKKAARRPLVGCRCRSAVGFLIPAAGLLVLVDATAARAAAFGAVGVIVRIEGFVFAQRTIGRIAQVALLIALVAALLAAILRRILHGIALVGILLWIERIVLIRIGHDRLLLMSSALSPCSGWTHRMPVGGPLPSGIEPCRCRTGPSAQLPRLARQPAVRAKKNAGLPGRACVVSPARAGQCRACWRLLVVADRGAAAEQVTVAVHVVGAAHRRPVFLLAQRRYRVSCHLAAVLAVPHVGGQHFGRVRREFQRVVQLVEFAAFHLGDLVADGDHGVDEAVHLHFRFAFRRLDHQGAGYREAHGRRMETEVHQALGHILVGDAGGVLQRTQVDDALVRHQAVVARVQHRIVRRQAAGDIVGAQDGVLGGGRQTFGAHHGDVHPRNRQDAGRAVWRRADCADAGVVADIAVRALVRQELGQVRAHADRPHARTAAAVRNAERLVQVQVRDVAAERARSCHADQRIHVGAVDIHLAAVAVHDLAQLLDAFLEHAVGGRVGDHGAGQVFRVQFRFRFQVGQVHVAVGVARGDHHLHAHHAGRRRVGAVRGRGDQADVAVAFIARLVVRLDHQQTGILTLRTGIRLQRDGGVSGDGAQHFFQLRDHFAVAHGLAVGGERVDVRELGPGDRDHFGRGVELHGARAERDHGAVQRQVLVGQAAQVAQHFGFGVVAVEHGVRQVRAGAGQVGRERFSYFCFDGVEIRAVGRAAHRMGKHGPQQGDVFAGGGFVERNAHVRRVDHAQVHAVRVGRSVQLLGIGRGDGQRVEEGLVGDGVAEGFQVGGQDARVAVHALGDLLQAFWTVVHGVHRGDHRQQHLRGADVGRGFFAADVLFARLQRQAICLVALRVDGHAHQAARHAALEFIAGGQVAGVRAAESQRHAEALAVADDDVRAPFARWREHGQRQQVGGDDHHRAGGFDCRHAVLVIAHHAVHARVLQQHTEGVRHARQFGRVERFDRDAQRLGAGFDHFARLRQHVVGHVERGRLRLAHALDQRHRFGRSRAFVEHGRIGDAHAGEVGDGLLEVQDRFQAALRNLGLVRRVRGVPGRVLEDVTQDDARRGGVVVALADQRLEDLVFRGDLFQPRQRFAFRQRLRVRAQRQRGLVADVGRNDGVDQGGAGRIAERRQHGLLFGGVRADVARDKGVAGFELGQAGAGHGIGGRGALRVTG